VGCGWKGLGLGMVIDMDTSWTGPPLGAGDGFEAILLNFPTHPQVEM